MKFSRRKLLGGSALATLTSLLPRRGEAWIHGSPPINFQLGQRPFAASSPGNTLLSSSVPLTPVPWPAFNGGNYFVIKKIPLDVPNIATAPSCVVHAVNPGWQNPAGDLAARPMTAGFDTNFSDTDQEVCSLVGNDIFSYWLFDRYNSFTGTGSGTNLTASAVTGILAPGLSLSGTGVPANTTIVSQTSGVTGGAGVYVTSNPTTSSAAALVAGDDAHARCYAYGHTNIVTESGFGTTFPNAVGVFATGQSCMMGTLFKEEFTANIAAGKNYLEHIINLCMDANDLNQGTAYSPAIHNDSGGFNGFAVEGQLLAIPAGTAQPAGLTTYGAMIFQTLLVGSGHCYGAFVCDQGGSNQFYLGTSYNNPSGSWNATDLGSAPSLYTDAQALIPLLQKVGYPLDGLLSVIPIYDSFDPQCQRLSLVASSLLSITRDSDSTSLAIGQTAGPQSLLDTSAIATFCAGTTGRVTTYHGAFGHDLVSVGSQAPAIYASGALKATANGTPAMFFDGTGANIMQYASSSASYPNGTMYLFAKGVQLADYLASYTLVSGDTAGCLEVRVDVTTGLVRLLAQGGTTIGVTPYSIPLNVPVNISAFYNSDGSYSIWLNGVKVVQGTGTLVTVAAANIRVGAGPSGANPLKGLIVGGMINFNASAYAWNNPQYMIERYQNNFLGPMGAIVVPTTTFDPAHISSNIVLSNGNLTARYNSSGSNVNAFGTISKSAGLFYHELRINTKGAGHEFIGYANNSFSTAISQALGNDVAKNSVGWWSTGEVKIGGSTLTTIATYATGSVLGLCLDLTHSKVWFGVISGSTVLWNNDVLANQNPATNTGGISISTITAGALFPCVTLQTFNDQITTNFGATAYTNATLLPSGFGNWQ